MNIMTIVQVASAAAEGGEKSGIAVLGIDPKAVILQAGTFLLLFLIVKKFALRGIIDTLEQRRLTIDKGVELGQEMEKKKIEFDAEVDKLRRQARSAADDIIAAAHKDAGQIIKDGEASAAQKVQSMLDDAEARIGREMAKARTELRAEMQNLVADATEVIIHEKLDAKKDASLLARALSSLNSLKGAN